MVWEAGLAKIGVFVRLKASERISNQRFSPRLNLLLSERSKRLIPGPRTVPIPTFPKVRAAGWEYGAGSRNRTPGPIWCGSFGVLFTLARKLRASVPEGSPLILMVSGNPPWAV